MTDHDPKNDRLLWLDWETWGLGEFADVFLEVGWCITDWDGHEIHRIVSHPIRWSREDLNSLPKGELFEPHRSNGLLDDCCSDSALPIKSILLSLRIDVRQELEDGHRVLLAGNSVAFDRDRARTAGKTNDIPDVIDGVSHRLIDMSCIWECYRAWNPEIAVGQPERITDHRSRHCLEDSLNLFRYWRSVIADVQK